MIMNKQALFAVLLVSNVCLFLSCSSGPSVKIPGWIDPSYRSNSEYFHGYAQVEKTGNRQDYLTECNDIALGNIAKSISSHVKVKSDRKVRELEKLGLKNAYSLDKSFDMISTVRSEMTLERVENVGEWEDDRYYYVYKRLSVAVYEEALRNKINNAIQSAGKDYQEAFGYLKDDPIRALGYFISAYRFLIPFQDQLLISQDPLNPEREINIDVEIRALLRNLIQDIELIPDNNTVNGIAGKAVKKPLSVTAYYNEGSGIKHSLKNVPLRFFFEKGAGDLVELTKTDKQGKAQSTISRVISSERHQEVRVRLDLDAFLGTDEISRIILAEFENVLIPYGQFELIINPVTIFMDAREYSLGHPVDNPIVIPVLMKSLESTLGARFSKHKQDADYTLEVRIDTEELGKAYTLFTATAQMNVYFKENGNTIFANSFTGIKGIHTSFELASVDALKKLAEKVQNEVAPEISRQFLE